ncbi:fluconazole resistance protein [Ilyonectria robusta]
MNWRWIFWIVSAADALVQVLAFLFLQETYPPKILKVKAKKLRKETGNKSLRTEYERPDQTFSQSLRKNLMRPFIMLFTQPAIQITALYRAYLYGLMYLVYVDPIPVSCLLLTISTAWPHFLWFGRSSTTRSLVEQVSTTYHSELDSSSGSRYLAP